MRVCTLSIGDELISGRVIDSNAAVIAAKLLEQGIPVLRHQTVGDNEPDIMGALTDLGRMCDAVIVTGGLGPTADDMTARAASRATGRRLIINDEAREHLHRMSSQLPGQVYCTLNDKQSMLPSKSTLIPNPNGTACGFHLIHNGCFMFFLPGVPAEMGPMLHDTVVPFLVARLPRKQIIRLLHLNLFGVSEGSVDQLLLGIAQPEQGVTLGICVNFPWMRITLRSESDSAPDAEAKLSVAAAAVRERLKEYLFSEGERSLAGSVAELFNQSGLTLALAESCTGGMISQAITDVPGCSQFFREAAITYSNAAKSRQLGVSQEILLQHGAVSSECAAAMSKGVRSVAEADLGLAVTGIAGPEGGSDEKPVGTVFISLAAPDGCWTKRFSFSGSRDAIRIMTTWTALDWLRRYLVGRRLP